MTREAYSYPFATGDIRDGRINAENNGRYGVLTDDGQRFWLAPAFSCLVRPVVGDRVLITVLGTAGFVLAVLERESHVQTDIRFPGNCTIAVESGTLEFRADESIALDAGKTMVARADYASLAFGEAQLVAGQLGIAGQQLESHWVHRRETSTSVHEHAVQHYASYGTSYRHVAGHESVRVGSCKLTVEKDYSLQGETLDLFAELATTVRGDSIKLG